MLTFSSARENSPEAADVHRGKLSLRREVIARDDAAGNLPSQQAATTTISSEQSTMEGHDKLKTRRITTFGVTPAASLFAFGGINIAAWESKSAGNPSTRCFSLRPAHTME